ncbi:hypothetical protein DJ71_14505 [Halorubrum sp. E3]|nr:hypothetical protein DJ71_14505 [Halorubrum sp. E3]
MNLQLPTDRLILETLEDGRNLAVNISLEIDRSRNYINGRMTQLLDYDLVSKVGPAENTGLYELTERGQAVLYLLDEGDDPSSAGFEERVEQRLN